MSFNFCVQKKTFSGAVSFSINLINDYLNPRNTFLKLNHDKNICLDILLSYNKVLVVVGGGNLVLSNFIITML